MSAEDILKSDVECACWDFQSMKAQKVALLERVTVLERALEGVADPLGWPPSLRDREYVVEMRRLAQKALDGS